MMNKLNMVIGAFFSEVGLDLLKIFSRFSQNIGDLEQKLQINPNWKQKDFTAAMDAVKKYTFDISSSMADLEKLRDFLVIKRSFLLRLLENQNLLEHERFTDLLWAVFHLTEELAIREDQLTQIPQSDLNHLSGDIKRAYSQLTREWIAYTHHLKKSYPFLFSLAARINPLNPQASPLVMS